MTINDDIVFGRNSVAELLDSDQEIDTIYINEKNAQTFGKIKNIALEKGIIVKIVKQEKIIELAGNVNTQGVVAAISPVKYSDIDEILSTPVKEKNIILICDGIEDSHNLGAILRTAEAIGVDGVILPKRRSAAVNGTVFKTSSGAAAHLKIAKVSNLTDTIKTLKDNNFWIYGADMDGQPFTQMKFSGKIALVVGSEGKGIGNLIKKNCDFTVNIPMFGKINSLNVSVATAVLLYAMKL
jgi:23S rRNA (guanosine2251-2'-O)-methyltransferase